MKKVALAVAATAAVLAVLSGCSAEAKPGPATASPTAPVSSTPSPIATLPTTQETATPLPAPDDQTLNYDVGGFNARDVFNSCQVAVAGQYAYLEPDHPGITKFASFGTDSVRDASTYEAGHVAVFAPSVPQEGGKPLMIWVCEFSGDPANPHLEYASFRDK